VIALWRWLASFGAPIALAFFAGVFFQQARDARAEAAALERASRDAAAQIEAAGATTVAAIEAARRRDQERQVDYERLQAVIRRNMAPAGDCAAGADDVERVRLKTDAANGYALGGVPGGSGAGARGE